MHTTSSWTRTLAEHEAAVKAFLAVTEVIPDADWQRPREPGAWSPAEEVLHVAFSYEAALRGLRTGAGMRPQVSPMRARMLRWLVLPVMLNSNWFPRATAPVEVRPPADIMTGGHDLTPAALRARLERLAGEIRDEVPRAAPDFRFRHAYFGELAPRPALRMLSAHTRHHARALARRFRKVME